MRCLRQLWELPGAAPPPAPAAAEPAAAACMAAQGPAAAATLPSVAATAQAAWMLRFTDELQATCLRVARPPGQCNRIIWMQGVLRAARWALRSFLDAVSVPDMPDAFDL